MNPPLHVRVYRGRLLEAVHEVAIAVVSGDRLVRSAGDPDRPTYFRSAAKPIQALAVVETGAAAAFGLVPAEIALAAGSHNGEEIHVRAARSILAKAGVPEEALACGTHPPAGEEARDALMAAGGTPGPIHNNCSGKHAAMLATAKHLKSPLETYLDPDHPVQRRNLANVAAFTGLAEAEITIGVDGCSAPVFGLPLVAMARAFARFASPGGLPPERREAVRTVLDAIAAHPEMVAGKDRNDTEMMVATRGRLLTKIGAEGLQLVGVRDADLGIALKVTDGNPRAYKWVLPSLLRELGVLSEEEAAGFGDWADLTLRNWRGIEIGHVEVGKS